MSLKLRRNARETASGLEADQEPLEVGLTMVSRSRRISIDNLDHTPMESPASYSPIYERAPGNPLFPMNSSTLSIGLTLPARLVPFFFSLCVFMPLIFQRHHARHSLTPLARNRAGEDKDWRPKVLASPWQ